MREPYHRLPVARHAGIRHRGDRLWIACLRGGNRRTTNVQLAAMLGRE